MTLKRKDGGKRVLVEDSDTTFHLGRKKMLQHPQSYDLF